MEGWTKASSVILHRTAESSCSTIQSRNAAWSLGLAFAGNASNYIVLGDLPVSNTLVGVVTGKVVPAL